MEGRGGGQALPPAGWYSNPEGPGLRWWDGTEWTEHYQQDTPPPPEEPGPDLTQESRPDADQAPSRSGIPAEPGRSGAQTHSPSTAAGGGAWASGRDRAPFFGALVAAALLIIGGFGPWVTWGPFTVAGTDGDGWFLVGSGAVAVGLLLALNAKAGPRRRLKWLIPIAAAVGTFVVLMDIVEILRTDLVSVGWGAWVGAIAGTALVGLSIYLARPTRRGLPLAVLASIVVAGSGVGVGIATADDDADSELSTSDSNGEAEGETSFFDESEAEAEKAPPAPSIRVAEQGFSQDDSGVSYGAILKNPSKSTGASEISVTVNFLDGAGTVISTETAEVAAMPPGSTFGVGGTGYIEGEQVARVKFAAKAAASSAETVKLLKGTSVRIIDGEFGREARAQIVNSGTDTISSINDIFFLYRGTSGRIVGGAQTFPDAEIPPGGRAAVEATDIPGAATQAEVFIDAES